MPKLSFRREHGLVLLLLTTTALVFSPGLLGDFVWDDWPLIVRNEFARNPSHLPHVLTSSFWDVSSRSGVGRLAYLNLYRPVVSLAYVTQFQLFGESALGYHVVSLVLHVACVGLGVAWLRPRLPSPSMAAVALGMIPFALHPSRPEVVSWISGCTDLWMTFWALLGMLALRQPRIATRALGGAAIALAVLSKEAAIVVPVLLAVDAWLIEGRRPSLSKEGWAFGGAALATAIHLAMVPPVSAGASELGNVVSRVGATLGHFVVRTTWFFDPSIEPVPRLHDAAGTEVFAGWSVALGLALVAAIGALALVAKRRPGVRPWLADSLWYLVPLLPVSNLVGLSGPTLVADRYLYLPLLGVAALLARALVAPINAGPPRRTIALALGGALALSCGAVSSTHALNFRSDLALWSHELARDPDSLNGIRNVASDASASGDTALALALYLRGKRAAQARNDPEQVTSFALQAIGALLSRTSDADQDRLSAMREAYDRFVAEPRLRIDLEELQLDERVPDEVWEDLRRSTSLVALPRATAYARTGQLREAESQLGLLLRERPREAAAWTLAVAVFARQGKWEAARLAIERAMRRVPGNSGVEAMGRVLEQAAAVAAEPAGDPIAAAVRDARVQTLLGAPEAARAILDEALRQDPTSALLIMERARTDVADRRFDLARARLEQARDADVANAARWEHALRQLQQAEAQHRDQSRGATLED